MNENYFDIDGSLVYLNHAAVSPWPLRTAGAVRRFAEESARFGATHYARWLETEQELRTLMAWLVNAPSSDDISILKNTSEALSVVAYGIDWNPGDNVVLFDQEFPSNRIVWESLDKFGVEARIVEMARSTDPEPDLLAACDERTRLISVSSVQYARGQRMNLEAIGSFCRREGILFCVDAIQSLGAIPFDLQKLGADFVMADGHKWMMGPEGVALLYTRRDVRDAMKLHQYGWRMVADAGNYDTFDWTPSDSGTRFECGTPNMLGIHGLAASLALIRELGVDSIFSRILENTEHMIQMIEASPGRFTLLSDPRADRRSGIVTFRVEGKDQAHVYRTLMKAGVICASRGGGIRLSPHFYTSREDLDEAWRRLNSLI